MLCMQSSLQEYIYKSFSALTVTCRVPGISDIHENSTFRVSNINLIAIITVLNTEKQTLVCRLQWNKKIEEK